MLFALVYRSADCMQRFALHLAVFLRVRRRCARIPRRPDRSGRLRCTPRRACGRHRPAARSSGYSRRKPSSTPMARSHCLRMMSCAAASYSRGGADLRVRRHARHAQEILDGAGAVAALLLRLALLVDGGGEALGEVVAQLLVGADEIARLERMPAPPCRTRRGRSSTARRWSRRCAASAASTGGWRASTISDTSMARGRSFAAKISSAARVSTPALSGCSGNACANFTPASVAFECHSVFAVPLRCSSSCL